MSTRLTSGISATARLIDQQLRNWELSRQQRRRPESSPARPEVEDFICLSRMVGVEVEPVATTLGQRLGWPVFGRELLDAMAGDDVIRQRIYASMDERDLNWWEESLRAVLDKGFVRNDYFCRLCETVLSLARQSNSIFVGRGTDLILPQQLGLRVRLIASLEHRIENHARRSGLDPIRARQEVEHIDHQRTEFFRHRFRIEAADPVRHDLILNLERWTPEEAIDLILKTRSLRGPQPRAVAAEPMHV